MTTSGARFFDLSVIVLALSLGAGDKVASAQGPQQKKPDEGKPQGAAEYEAPPRRTDGQQMALAVQKLKNRFDPDRPFLIWAIGSSYTNMLGNGDELIKLIRTRFPETPEIIYKKMVGNSAPWQYLRGWARHLVVPDQPDLVLIYTIGKKEDLDTLIAEIRRGCTADIIVPTIHWRERGRPLWGNSDSAPDQDVDAIREICKKYDVEFVENRNEWAEYLKANDLQIEDLLKDAVHQSTYGATVINMNIARHINEPRKFAYRPEDRERRLEAESFSTAGKVTADKKEWSVVKVSRGCTVAQTSKKGASIKVKFKGNRIDLIGLKSPTGGTAKILIDGMPADEAPVFYMSYVQPGKNNFSAPRQPCRDQSPHGITLGKGIVPQTWTITMTNDTGEYQLVGSVTGPAGEGNAFKPFTSKSGQIIIEPELWRRAENNRTGDTFTFEVYRCSVGEVSFKGEKDEKFRTGLVQNMTNGPHTIEIIANGDGRVVIDAFDVFEPPLK